MKEKIVEHRVYYYDTDKMGVVYHSNYLKWMEVARTEFFRDILPYSTLEEMGVMLPVKTLNIEYFNSVKYDELIKIKIKLQNAPSQAIQSTNIIVGSVITFLMQHI